MKVLACGDRNWKNQGFIDRTMEQIALEFGSFVVIEGCAQGADRMVESWADWYEIEVHHHPANWKQYGRAAGPLRNREMLNEEPDLVVAFHRDLHKSKGTRHMVEIARIAGVPVRLYSGFIPRTEGSQ